MTYFQRFEKTFYKLMPAKYQTDKALQEAFKQAKQETLKEKKKSKQTDLDKVMKLLDEINCDYEEGTYTNHSELFITSQSVCMNEKGIPDIFIVFDDNGKFKCIKAEFFEDDE